jgi:hypothetical protein
VGQIRHRRRWIPHQGRGDQPQGFRLTRGFPLVLPFSLISYFYDQDEDNCDEVAGEISLDVESMIQCAYDQLPRCVKN